MVWFGMYDGYDCAWRLSASIGVGFVAKKMYINALNDIGQTDWRNLVLSWG